MRNRALWSLMLTGLLLSFLLPAYAAKPELKFRADGTFKIVMYSDVQDDAELDPRATALMGKVLDTEKPDMVVIGGDCIAGGACPSVELVKKAIAAVAAPTEDRKVPWAIVFGNHDQEHFGKTKLSAADVMKIYQSYPCNLNTRGDKNIHGVGNAYLLVKGHADNQPVFNIWLLDSGAYAPQGIGGYDWIRADQVAWYSKSSKDLESRYGHKIPALMYFHIPLREFIDLSTSGKIKGDKFESEGCAKLNSGLFSAVLDRGDVKGIFCGHEHINNYVGEWMGVKLGYDSSIGFADYNLPDSNPNHIRTRGARVFQISESDPANFKTWMRFSDGSTDQ